MQKKLKTKFIFASVIIFAVVIFSGYVNVVKASGGVSLSITSPKAGAKWKVGETRVVKWKAKNIDKVGIYIYDSRISGSGSTNYITPNGDKVSASKGSYAWTIMLNQLIASDQVKKMNNFKIQIHGYDKSGNEIIFKESKGKFTISK